MNITNTFSNITNDDFILMNLVEVNRKNKNNVFFYYTSILYPEYIFRSASSIEDLIKQEIITLDSYLLTKSKLVNVSSLDSFDFINIGNDITYSYYISRLIPNYICKSSICFEPKPKVDIVNLMYYTK
jgi:hypothetical protein